MSEYISKEEINRVLLNRIDMNNKCLSGARESKHFEEEKYFSTLIFEDEQIKALFEESAPTADVRPNIHGHWIKIISGDEDFPESIVCDRCNHENSHLDFNEHNEPIGKVFVTSNFCPNCGADMRGKSCNACKNNDDEFSAECYECVKGIENHFTSISTKTGRKFDE